MRDFEVTFTSHSWRATFPKRFKAFQIRFSVYTEEQSKGHIPLFAPPTTLIMIYGRWWKAISKSNKCAFAQVLTWGKLHCLPTTNSFARFQFKQQIAQLEAFHMACTLTYVKNMASLFGSSRMHQRGNWQVSAASGHLCLPHLNIALGIFLISLHKNFRNALRVWNFKLPKEFYLFNWIGRSTKD